MSTRIDADEIIREVRENQAKLNSCAGPHDFQPSQKYESGMTKKYACLKCHGTVTVSDRNWYVRGLAHGSRITFFEVKDGPMIVELSTRRYHLQGDKVIELHLHGVNPNEWVPSERSWPLSEITIKMATPIAD